MTARLPFSKEVANLLWAAERSPVTACIQCGTCSATCPAVEFMDHSPREIIAMIRAELRDKVLASNAFWYCASCYQCTVRCPQRIDITDMMYALKRYSIWRNQYQKGLIGPGFSKLFVTSIIKRGKAFEPGLAPSYVSKYGLRGLLAESCTALRLFLKGRLPVIPARVKRIKQFRRLLGRIIPVGGLA